MLFFNWAFRIKLLLVVIGLILTWRLVKICIAQTNDVSPAKRLFAGVAMTTWMAALHPQI